MQQHDRMDEHFRAIFDEQGWIGQRGRCHLVDWWRRKRILLYRISAAAGFLILYRRLVYGPFAVDRRLGWGSCVVGAGPVVAHEDEPTRSNPWAPAAPNAHLSGAVQRSREAGMVHIAHFRLSSYSCSETVAKLMRETEGLAVADCKFDKCNC
jgi:hypothetical protein